MLVNQSINDTKAEVESLIASFRTPFWLEEKRWCVACDLIEERYASSNYRKTRIMTYTLPFMTEVTEQDHDFRVVTSLNNSPNGHLEVLNYSETKTHLQSTSLNLRIEEKWQRRGLRSLARQYDLTSVVELSVVLLNHHDTNASLAVSLHNLLHRLPNLRRLQLGGGHETGVEMTSEQLYLMIPRYVEHLYMDQRSYQRMKIIADRLNFLSTITYNYNWNIKYDLVNEIFKQKQNGWQYYLDNYYVYIWIETQK